jgi:hypothetical protein
MLCFVFRGQDVITPAAHMIAVAQDAFGTPLLVPVMLVDDQLLAAATTSQSRNTH